MAATVTHDQWMAVRTALGQTGDRFAEMVSRTSEPLARATPDWSVVDTAAHVAVIARLYTSMVRADDSPLAIPALTDQILATTVDTVGDVNERALRLFVERDPQALAQLLRTDIDEILRASDGSDPTTPVTWLGDSRVPLAGVLAHLVNELLIHGRDIARAIHSPWVMPAPDAAMFFELFLVGLLRNDVGRLLDTDEPPRKRRIAVEFRSRHTAAVTLVLRDGKVSVEEPGPDTDVRLSFDPATLNLMMFGRISRPRAVLTGKVVISGRRPWLLPAFMRTVRLPHAAPDRRPRPPAEAGQPPR